MIDCILSVQRPISSSINSLLYRKAREMASGKRKSRITFKSKECQGILTTKWDSQSFAGVAGIYFTAKFADEKGENEASFIVRSFLLEDIPAEKWATTDSPEEAARQILEQEAAEHSRSGRKLN